MEIGIIVVAIIIVLLMALIAISIINNKKDTFVANGNILWRDRKHTILGFPLSFTVYSIDKERIFINKGIFTSIEDEVRLYRVLDIQSIQNLRQKIFGLGDIRLQTSDKSMQNFTIKNVCYVKNVKELISENVEIQRRKNRVSSREIMLDSDDEEDDIVD